MAYRIYTLGCLFAGGALLCLGLIFYLTSRARLPVLLSVLHISPHVVHLALLPNAILSSLPDFLHVAAFSLFTCAVFPPSKIVVFVSSLTWVAIDTLWELSCVDHQAWLRFIYERLGLGGMPLGTYDPGDIVAAIAGGAAAVLLALLLVHFAARDRSGYYGDSKTKTRAFVKGLGTAGLLTLGVFLTVASTPQPQPSPSPPPQWAVTDTLVNANSPLINKGSARQVVFFSKIQWQTTAPRQATYADGWRNDVLVGNPYSFQVIVSGGNFLNGGLILRDVATGQEIQATAPRVNHSHDCGQYLGAPPSSIQCYWSPGQQGFIQRPTLPTNTASYSVELVNSCQGVLQYTDLRCPENNGPQAQVDVVTVLTISPPVSPSIPLQGQKFLYDLVSRNSSGQQSTLITAVYVDPNQCTIDNLAVAPAIGTPAATTFDAGTLMYVQWMIRNCHQGAVGTNDQSAPELDYWQVAQNDEASEPSVNRTAPYVLPKISSVEFTVTAYDAMGKKKELSQTVTVSPCTVDPTSKDCPTRCNHVPPPSGCPVPPPPQCPVGQGDSHRQDLQFTFTILCSGSVTTHQETDYGCTQAEALTASKNRWAGSNCGPIGMGVLTSPGMDGSTTPPPPDCMNGATKQDFKVCLVCGTTASTLSFKLCTEQDAEDAARLNCTNQSATVMAGECQKSP